MELATASAAVRASLAAILAAALAGGAATTAACQPRTDSKMAPEAAIEAEIATRLPPGTRSTEVEAWLAAKGLTHSGLIDNAKLAHMGFDPGTLEIKALVRGSARPALVRSDTQLTFVFDRERRLVRAQVAPVHTGL